MSNYPLITIALFSYNQENFIHEAVCGVLSQDYFPLQIIISDDCSTDKTYSIACDSVGKYDGPHSVLLNKNGKNLGIGEHINKIMELAEGELIVAAAGDDISFPERVSAIVKHWISTEKRYYSICSDMIVIDNSGELAARLPTMKSVTFDKVLDRPSRWMKELHILA